MSSQGRQDAERATDELNAGEGGVGAPGDPASSNHAPDLTREYHTERISVRWYAHRCIHSHNCVRGLPKVFDAKRRPWVDANAAAPDALVATILRCPSGALHFVRLDGGAQEAPDVPTTITPIAGGPNYVRGDVALIGGGDSLPIRGNRMALCRCSLTARAPFCDNNCHISVRLAEAPE